jgi:hypothetical protein
MGKGYVEGSLVRSKLLHLAQVDGVLQKGNIGGEHLHVGRKEYIYSQKEIQHTGEGRRTKSITRFGGKHQHVGREE